VEKDRSHDGAETIDGNDRSEEEAAVLPPVFPERTVGTFKEPAEDAENKKFYDISC
jgi:hypothetical protein